MIKIKNHNTEIEIIEEIKITKDGRYRLKLNVILEIKKGKKAKEIQSNFLISQTTYYRWLKKYNKGGVELLKTNLGGRAEGNPKYENKIFKELFLKLDEMEEWWSVLKMVEFVKERHNVDVLPETMRVRVKKAGYSWKSNRPSPYKGDKDKQESFKKTDSGIWSKY